LWITVILLHVGVCIQVCSLQGVEDLCIHKLGQSLYEKLSVECEEHIKTNIAGQASLSLLRLVCSMPCLTLADFALFAGLISQISDPVLFLELVQHTWDSHCKQMSIIRSIFLYLVSKAYMHSMCLYLCSWRKYQSCVRDVRIGSAHACAGLLIYWRECVSWRKRKSKKGNKAICWYALIYAQTCVRVYINTFTKLFHACKHHQTAQKNKYYLHDAAGARLPFWENVCVLT
jgi:hypothetical protein